MRLTTRTFLPCLGLAVVPVLAALPLNAAHAQRVSGEAYGAYVQTPVAQQDKAPLAVLPSVAPPDGAISEAASETLNVGSTLGTDLLTSVTTGAIGATRATAQSVSTVADVSILSGLIRADHIVAVANSTSSGASAASDAYGSTFENLVVNGVPITVGDGAVSPNRRISLPGVGYVVLNEQIRTGNGVRSSGMTLNMIHVVLESTVTDLLGQTTTVKTGEIIVGSAHSFVER